MPTSEAMKQDWCIAPIYVLSIKYTHSLNDCNGPICFRLDQKLLLNQEFSSKNFEVRRITNSDLIVYWSKYYMLFYIHQLFFQIK